MNVPFNGYTPRRYVRKHEITRSVESEKWFQKALVCVYCDPNYNPENEYPKTVKSVIVSTSTASRHWTKESIESCPKPLCAEFYQWFIVSDSYNCIKALISDEAASHLTDDLEPDEKWTIDQSVLVVLDYKFVFIPSSIEGQSQFVLIIDECSIWGPADYLLSQPYVGSSFNRRIEADSIISKLLKHLHLNYLQEQNEKLEVQQRLEHLLKLLETEAVPEPNSVNQSSVAEGSRRRSASSCVLKIPAAKKLRTTTKKPLKELWNGWEKDTPCIITKSLESAIKIGEARCSTPNPTAPNTSMPTAKRSTPFDLPESGKSSSRDVEQKKPRTRALPSANCPTPTMQNPVGDPQVPLPASGGMLFWNSQLPQIYVATSLWNVYTLTSQRYTKWVERGQSLEESSTEELGYCRNNNPSLTALSGACDCCGIALDLPTYMNSYGKWIRSVACGPSSANHRHNCATKAVTTTSGT